MHGLQWKSEMDITTLKKKTAIFTTTIHNTAERWLYLPIFKEAHLISQDTTYLIQVFSTIFTTVQVMYNLVTSLRDNCILQPSFVDFSVTYCINKGFNDNSILKMRWGKGCVWFPVSLAWLSFCHSSPFWVLLSCFFINWKSFWMSNLRSALCSKEMYNDLLRLSLEQGTMKVWSPCFDMKIIQLSWATGYVSSGNLLASDIIAAKHRKL